MNILLKRRTIIIAAAAVLIALVSIISVTIFSSSGPISSIINTVATPLRSLTSTIASTFEGIYDSIYRYDSLLARYERALETISVYERDFRESRQLAEENEEFRALLGFRERYAGYDSEGAAVEDRTSSNWSSSFTINKGYSNSSITRGNGVVTEYGMLIGQVSQVEATTSTVVTVLDTTFSVSVLVGEAGGMATLRGDFALMRTGLLVLDHIDDDLVVMVGDRVVTSGIGAVFPLGLVVGEVTEVLWHNTGIGRYAIVEPIREISTITNVFVITGFGE